MLEMVRKNSYVIASIFTLAFKIQLAPKVASQDIFKRQTVWMCELYMSSVGAHFHKACDFFFF